MHSVVLSISAAEDSRDLNALIELRLTDLASHCVGNRPHRLEPRAMIRNAGKMDGSLQQPQAAVPFRPCILSWREEYACVGEGCGGPIRIKLSPKSGGWGR